MVKKEFGEIINAHQQSQSIDDFHRQQIQEWRDLLDQLIQDIETILEPEISAGKISIAPYEVTLREGALGVYPMRSINLNVGNTQVALEPQGTMYIGTKGRAILRGPKGEVVFMLLRKQESKGKDDIGPEDWVWTIWNEPYVTEPVGITAESVRDAIAKVLDG